MEGNMVKTREEKDICQKCVNRYRCECPFKSRCTFKSADNYGRCCPTFSIEGGP